MLYFVFFPDGFDAGHADGLSVQDGDDFDSVGAVGLLWNRNSTAWLGISMTTEQRNAAFSRLEKVGSITALAGAPYFIWLVLRKR